MNLLAREQFQERLGFLKRSGFLAHSKTSR